MKAAERRSVEVREATKDLEARLAAAIEASTAAHKSRKKAALAAAQGDQQARKALADYTAEQDRQEALAEELRLAIDGSKDLEDETARAFYVAKANYAFASALAIAKDIREVAAEIDALWVRGVELLAQRDMLYTGLRATGARLPSIGDTRMDEWKMGLSFASAIRRTYGEFVTQQRIFPSLIHYRDYAETMQDQEERLLSQIGRPSTTPPPEDVAPGSSHLRSAQLISDSDHIPGMKVVEELHGLDVLDDGSHGATPVFAETQGPGTGRVFHYGEKPPKKPAAE
jgi:hypothetical protein